MNIKLVELIIVINAVEEKIKGQMVKRHILAKDDFIHVLTAFGDKLNEDEIECHFYHMKLSSMQF